MKISDVKFMNLSGKGPRPVGILKNGNRASHLKLIKLKWNPQAKMTQTRVHLIALPR